MGADRTLVFPTRPAIVSAASIAGPKEGQGPLGDKFDVVLEEDLLGQISWEMAESEMLRRTVELCCQKGGIAVANVQALLSGDLNNQIIASTFAARALGTPFLGLYGACSTFVEALILGAMLVDGGIAKTRWPPRAAIFARRSGNSAIRWNWARSARLGRSGRPRPRARCCSRAGTGRRCAWRMARWGGW